MIYLVFETLVSCSYKLILRTRTQKLCDITKNQQSDVPKKHYESHKHSETLSHTPWSLQAFWSLLITIWNRSTTTTKVWCHSLLPLYNKKDAQLIRSELTHCVHSGPRRESKHMIREEEGKHQRGGEEEWEGSCEEKCNEASGASREAARPREGTTIQ